MAICLERVADMHVAQLMPLPLTVSCFSKIQIGFTFLVPAHPGSPGRRAVKRVFVTVIIVRGTVGESERVGRHGRQRGRLLLLLVASATRPSGVVEEQQGEQNDRPAARQHDTGRHRRLALHSRHVVLHTAATFRSTRPECR